MSDEQLKSSGRRVGPPPVDVTRRARKGFDINVHRQGSVVNLSLTAGDEYGAVELYEHFIRSLKQGKLSLNIG